MCIKREGIPQSGSRWTSAPSFKTRSSRHVGLRDHASARQCRAELPWLLLDQGQRTTNEAIAQLRKPAAALLRQVVGVTPSA